MFLWLTAINSQAPLFSDVPVSDGSLVNNSIGEANTSRNIAINSAGEIYVVYSGSSGIRVVKSVDRGQSFLPSVLVVNAIGETEIAVNERGDVFVAWMQGESIRFTKSNDGGNTFSLPIAIGRGAGDAVHMTTYENMVYIIDRFGSVVYANDNYGEGAFRSRSFTGYVYADVRTDKNGVVYVPADDPTLYLFKSLDSGETYQPVRFQNVPQIYFSSYALSQGPCGDFIFVGGGGDTNSIGYKIDVNTGANLLVSLGTNSGRETGRTLVADDRGTLIDGYKNANGELLFNVSYDQGENFGPPVLVAQGTSHNLEINHTYNDVVAVYSKDGQIFVSVYDNILKGITIDGQIPQPICAGASFDVSYTLLGQFVSNTTFSVYLSDSEGNFDNGTLLSTVSSNTSGTISVTIPENLVSSNLYKVKFQSTENCTESNLIQLSVQNPEIELQDVYLICDSDPTIELSIDPSFLSWEWTFEDGSVISNTNEASVSNVGSYAVHVTDNIGGQLCESTFSFRLERSQPPEISEIKINELSDANFIEIIPSGDALEYSLDGINYQDSNVFENLVGGEYTVRFRDKKGCGEGSETVILLDYPKFFTPNGDGINDRWQIKGLQRFPEAIIFIYDRYGKLIKQISANSSGWDGTFNGAELVTSDYWFVANLTNERQIIGHFTLKR
ncbi:T9SS type B sorting domain-containing protein [Hyunsoonleella flava]|uniref:T9SS type B sorting domain-containing protein n=1 Tax=Hyunsoonleella flava TaxID=2527939 RepID=A0A4Q9FBE2_9FLAO|nr:T9SS type B sorting domain-containing protein [Hyunsoonleella flava]TBN01318.1 T9SS type B sorting domain-containing protein [Hyunsoonleella flava]